MSIFNSPNRTDAILNEFDHLKNIEEFNLNFNGLYAEENNRDAEKEAENENESVVNNEIINGENINDGILAVDPDFPELSKNLQSGIPEVFKHFIKEGNISYHYNIAIGENISVICATANHHDELRKNLVLLARLFEEIYSKDEILNTASPLSSPKITRSICKIFASGMINDELIPRIELSKKFSILTLDLLPEGLKKMEKNKNTTNSEDYIYVPEVYFSEISKKMYQLFRFSNLTKQDLILSRERFSGLANVETLISKYQLDPFEFKQFLLFLWLAKLISFRIPKYDWDIFERTHKSNPFLYDGSEEQKVLIEKYEGGKIVSLLSRFDGRCSLKEIRKKMNISDLKMMEYVYDLLDMDLISKIPCYPKLKQIPEEKIPLLIIEGLTQDDLDLLETLKPNLQGDITLIELALKTDIAPSKMKVIFDKLEKFDLIERSMEF
jgi:hypothetical protein